MPPCRRYRRVQMRSRSTDRPRTAATSSSPISTHYSRHGHCVLQDLPRALRTSAARHQNRPNGVGPRDPGGRNSRTHEDELEPDPARRPDPHHASHRAHRRQHPQAPRLRLTGVGTLRPLYVTQGACDVLDLTCAARRSATQPRRRSRCSQRRSIRIAAPDGPGCPTGYRFVPSRLANCRAKLEYPRWVS